MSTTTAVRTIIYLRLSDFRYSDVDTFEDREAQLRGLAERLGWTVVGVVIENDVNKNGHRKSASAFKRTVLRDARGETVNHPDGSPVMRVHRPGFRSVLDDLWHGRADGVLAEHSDRLIRDLVDCEDLIEVVERKRLNVYSLVGPIFTDGGTDQEIFTQRGQANHANFSSRDTSRRVSGGRLRKAKAGKFGGGLRPFGFEADGVTLIEREAAIIRDCSTRVLQIDGNAKGRKRPTSLRSLASELRKGDVPTVTGAQWSAETLRDILLRPRNAGISIHRGKEVGRFPGEPIIPEHTYRAVVTLLTDPSRKAGPGPAAKWQGSGGAYLCGKCDDGTTGVEVTGGTKRNPYYRCKAHNHVRRDAGQVDKLLSEAVVARLSRLDAVDLIPTVDVPTVDVPGLQAEAARIRANLKSLTGHAVLGLIDEEQMIEATRVGRARLTEIKAQLDVAIVESPLTPLIGVEDVAAAWEKQPVHVRREIIATLFEVKILPATRRGAGFDRQSVSITPKPAPARASAPQPMAA